MTAVPLLIGATVLSAAGSIAQGHMAAQAHRYNARVAENEGIAAQQQAAFDEERQRERTARLLSMQRAAAGKSGVAPEGSPLLVMQETAADAELDALAIRYSGSIAELRARSAAAAERMQGRAALVRGYVGAGSSLLSGGARIAQARGGHLWE